MTPWNPHYEFLLSTTTNLAFTTKFELVYYDDGTEEERASIEPVAWIVSQWGST